MSGHTSLVSDDEKTERDPFALQLIFPYSTGTSVVNSVPRYTALQEGSRSIIRDTICADSMMWHNATSNGFVETTIDQMTIQSDRHRRARKTSRQEQLV